MGVKRGHTHTQREEQRLRLSENRVLTIFGPKRGEVIGEWRKLQNEELHDLYSLPTINQVIKLIRMKLAGYVAHMGENRVVYRVLVQKPEGKRQLGRPRHRMEDNIELDLQEAGWRAWTELI
jgi:hypothetical protein